MMNLERANELKSSALWGDVMEELDKEIFHLTQKLHTCTPEQLKGIQDEIRITRMLKNMPDRIIAREADVDGKHILKA